MAYYPLDGDAGNEAALSSARRVSSRVQLFIYEMLYKIVATWKVRDKREFQTTAVGCNILRVGTLNRPSSLYSMSNSSFCLTPRL